MAPWSVPTSVLSRCPVVLQQTALAVALALALTGCITVDQRPMLSPAPERGAIGFPQASPDGAVTCYSVHRLFDQCLRRL